jgi:hypothetical protein
VKRVPGCEKSFPQKDPDFCFAACRRKSQPFQNIHRSQWYGAAATAVTVQQKTPSQAIEEDSTRPHADPRTHQIRRYLAKGGDAGDGLLNFARKHIHYLSSRNWLQAKP